MDIHDPASSPFSSGDDEDLDLPEAHPQPAHSSQPQPHSQTSPRSSSLPASPSKHSPPRPLSSPTPRPPPPPPPTLLPDPTTTKPTTPPTLSTQLSTFKHHASHFHSLLDSIRVSLRRQILLQDQLELLIPTPPSGTTATSGSSSINNPAPTSAFDIGLLNVRSDNVGKDMEEELWNKARGFVENLERAREAAEAEMQLLGGAVGGGRGDRDVDMLLSQSILGGNEIERF
ncbi:hypothetical protein EV426DRAFT_712849 [Tirmania nivea]|nr:hypothetical protein EV426DRAFT_712849 [Tirmania nivea]